MCSYFFPLKLFRVLFMIRFQNFLESYILLIQKLYLKGLWLIRCSHFTFTLVKSFSSWVWLLAISQIHPCMFSWFTEWNCSLRTIISGSQSNLNRWISWTFLPLRFQLCWIIGSQDYQKSGMLYSQVIASLNSVTYFVEGNLCTIRPFFCVYYTLQLNYFALNPYLFRMFSLL